MVNTPHRRRGGRSNGAYLFAAVTACWFVACGPTDEEDWCAELAAVDECRNDNCVDVLCFPDPYIRGDMALTPNREFRGSSPGCPIALQTTLSRLALVTEELRQGTITDPRCSSGTYRTVLIFPAGDEPFTWGTFESMYMGTPLCETDDRFLPFSHFMVQIACRR